MSIPTNEEILALLDELNGGKCADDLESYWIDFKPFQDPKDDRKVAVEYAICFANADGGVVVFGVADKERGGRSNAIHGSGKIDRNQWERDIYQSTTPHLSVELEELLVPEGTGKVLVMRVPKGIAPPYGTSQGLYKTRVSKNCMPMDPQSFVKARISTGALDWSGQTAEAINIADLDPVEIARARNILQRFKPESNVSKLKDQQFLAGLGALREGKVTHTGLLLFGKEHFLTELCPQHQVHYVHQVSETKVARNDQYRHGLLNVLERIEQVFTGPTNPEQELSVGLFKLRIPAYPIDVVREAVLNAVTHRDYSDPGKVLIRHAHDELVVTSPGGFLADITPQNILRHESITRNQMLANAFLKLGLVEQSGVGRRRIFIPMLSYGKRIPLYETDGTRVILHIFDETFDSRMAALVAQWKEEGREIDLDGLLVLTYLRDHAFINTTAASKLLQLPRESARAELDHFAQPRTGILERRGRTSAATYHLTKGVAKDLLGKAAYTKTKGLNPIRYAEMVKEFLVDHGSITPQECRELLGLGDSQTSKVEVSRYLKQWSKKKGGFLRREGNPPKVRYFPVKET